MHRAEVPRAMTAGTVGGPSLGAPVQTEASGAPVAPPARERLWPLLVILVLGAALRLGLWGWFDGAPPQIWDERDYNTLAKNLVQYGEFAFEPGEPTSLRPPLYPALVAGTYRLFGLDNFQAVRLLQAVLSLINAFLLYRLARFAFSHRVGLWAAGLYCFYPSLLGFNNLLLTEVLFTFLYCAFCALVFRSLQRNSILSLAAAGVVLGLAALARSTAFLFPPILVVFLLLSFPGTWRRRLLAVGAVLAAFAATTAPWAVRNTRLHKTFVAIDHQGARNFMIGNYQHTPLYRSWTGAEFTGDDSWVHELQSAYPPEQRQTQGELDQLAMRDGLKFVASHPGLTLERDVIKFFNFWGLERELLAGVKVGYFGTISRPAFLLLAVTICGSYVFVLLAGVFGAIGAPPADRRLHLFLLLLIGYVCAMHTLSIGHSRYHLPVMPLVMLYAASAVAHRRAIWEQRRHWRFWLAAGVSAVFVGGWAWLIVVIDGERILNLLRSLA